MKSLIHCLTSTAVPLKFRNGQVISSHTLWWIWLLIHARIKAKCCAVQARMLSCDTLENMAYATKKVKFHLLFDYANLQYGHPGYRYRRTNKTQNISKYWISFVNDMIFSINASNIWTGLVGTFSKLNWIYPETSLATKTTITTLWSCTESIILHY